jgi:hypothetical protein
MVSRVVMVMTACAVAFACAPQAFAQTDAERAQLQLEEQRRVERERQQQDDLKRLEQQRIDAERDAKKYQPGPTSTTAPSLPDYPRGPAAGASTGGGGGGTDYHTLPALTAANNPLLGRWKTVAPKESTSVFGPLAQLLGQEVANAAGTLTDGLVSARCKQLFGDVDAVVEFRPDSLVAIQPDGSARLMSKVNYRSAGRQILVVMEGRISIPYRFDIADRNHVSQEECPFERVNSQRASLTPLPARPAVPPASVGPPGSAFASGPAQLTIATGVTSAGARFLPMGGVPVFVVTQDPVTSLNRANFRTPPGKETMAAWLDACRGNFQFCTVGMQAMTGSAVKRAQTDAEGKVDLGQLPAGHYYVVGMGATGNGGMFWGVPVDLHSGGNNLTLDQRNGAALKN